MNKMFKLSSFFIKNTNCVMFTVLTLQIYNHLLK